MSGTLRILEEPFSGSRENCLLKLSNSFLWLPVPCNEEFVFGGVLRKLHFGLRVRCTAIGDSPDQPLYFTPQKQHSTSSATAFLERTNPASANFNGELEIEYSLHGRGVVKKVCKRLWFSNTCRFKATSMVVNDYCVTEYFMCNSNIPVFAQNKCFL